jgi:hypothetical protein
MTSEERKSVADYLRGVASVIENGFAYDFEFQWHAGKTALANIQVLPVSREQRVDFDERRFAQHPHVAEICMSLDHYALGSGPIPVKRMDIAALELRASCSVSGSIENPPA